MPMSQSCSAAHASRPKRKTTMNVKGVNKFIDVCPT